MNAKNENNFDWTEAFKLVKKLFCNRCSDTCDEMRHIRCIEHYLFIVENWEIAYEERMKKCRQ